VASPGEGLPMETGLLSRRGAGTVQLDVLCIGEMLVDVIVHREGDGWRLEPKAGGPRPTRPLPCAGWGGGPAFAG